MTEEPAAPDDLAAAVADGADVDWGALASHAATPEARARIERFALLARIAGVHANGVEEAVQGAAVSGLAVASLPPYAAGDHWGPLHIVELLASGTFGTVYRAHDATLARDVALKIFHVPASGDHVAVDAVAEGRLLARVRHQHVVSVYGADQYDERVGLWMELIEGRTLEDELGARGPLPVPEVLAVGADLARALHAVHAAGLLHRDLKTQNVMRDARDGRVVLMDLSAGRDQLEAGAHSAWPATIAGSPLYLAPECLEGQPASTRSDIYGLGVVLYRLATGAYPVDGVSMADIADAHRARATTDLPHLANLPDPLVSALRRMLDAHPARRPATAAEVGAALAVAASPSRTGTGRTRAWMAAAAVTALVLGALAVLAPRQGEPSAPTRAPSARLTLTTSSPDARRAVERAGEAMQAVDGRHEALAREQLMRADGWLASAVDLDPSFASAWILRAKVAARLGRPGPEYLALAERALTLGAEAGPDERAFIEATAHRMRADAAPGRRDELQRAARAYEDLLQMVPGHYWSLRDLPPVYERLQRAEDAERIRLRAAEAHPGSLLLAAGAARVYLRRRESDALRRVATTALSGLTPAMNRTPSELSSQISWLALWQARDAWMAGDASRTLEALKAVERDARHLTNDVAQHVLAQAYQALGRFDDARAISARVAERERREFLVTLIDARQERWVAVKAVLEPVGSTPPGRSGTYSFMHIWAGLLDQAELMLPVLRASLPGAAWQQPQEFEAQLRVAQGRHREALDLFAPLLVDERGPRLRMHEAVAIARRGVGDVPGAISLLERFEREPILVHVEGFAGYDWLRCMTLLAELYQQEGRTTEAARVAGKVRAMLAHADAEHPFAARLARLP